MTTIECPMCLRPLPPVQVNGGVPEPRTADEALVMQLVGEGAVTVKAVTSRLTGDPHPAPRDIERVRRRLDACVRAGLLRSVTSNRGGLGGSAATRYRLTA